MNNQPKFQVNLIFEEIKLPPFDEILVLGKNSPHGKNGISKSFELLIPNGFEVAEINEGNVDCVFINKRIVTKMPLDKIVAILRERVFPFVSEGELLKVDFKVAVVLSSIDG